MAITDVKFNAHEGTYVMPLSREKYSYRAGSYAESGTTVTQLHRLSSEFDLETFLNLLDQQFVGKSFSNFRDELFSGHPYVQLDSVQFDSIRTIGEWLFTEENIKKLVTATDLILEIDTIDLESLAHGLNNCLAINVPTNPAVIGKVCTILERIIGYPADSSGYSNFEIEKAIRINKMKEYACEAYLRVTQNNIGIGREGFEKLLNSAFNSGGIAFASFLRVLPRLMRIGAKYDSLDRQAVIVALNTLKKNTSSAQISNINNLKLFALQEVMDSCKVRSID
jgi:hypothetical protein